MTRINRSKGFTLVEMTVSLVLLSFITIIGYQGLIFGINQWLRGSDKISFQYECYQAMSWMRDKISSSEIVKDINTTNNNYLFTGKADSVSFVARYNRSSHGGLYINKIKLSENKENIYVSYRLHHPAVMYRGGDDTYEKVELLSGVSSIQFSYYGKRKERIPQWYPSWESEESLPRLVRVKIENAAGEQFESIIHIETSNSA